MERTFEERLRDQATLSLDVTERILLGKQDVPDAQRKTALSLIGGQLKQQAVNNGRVTQIISLTKLGIQDKGVREKLAHAALLSLLPGVALGVALPEPTSGEVTAETQPALAAPATQG